MNDLQLHARLSALADDLAPDADPYEQVATARGLHRRQRRTRIGVAAAVATVAVVVVGVPSAVTSLSAPGGDIAAPGTTGLRTEAEAVRAEVERLGLSDDLPDSEQGFPCPDATDRLGAATGVTGLGPSGANAGGGTLTGCAWSTDGTAATRAEQRLDLHLRSAFDATPGSLRRELDDRAAEDACAWTPLTPGGNAAQSLLVCPGPQETWEITLPDDDGTGAWVLTAAVGAELPDRDRTASRAVAALWQLVHDLPAARP